MLPETTVPGRRTWALAWYNLALDAGHALGALASAAPTMIIRVWEVTPATAHRLIFLMCAAATVIGAVPYFALSGRIELERVGLPRSTSVGLDPQTRGIVARLALLFGLDSIGGGLLSSALIAYWFFLRYGWSEAQLAALFFTARVLNAASHVWAAWLARCIGLVNTMVFTHLPSSLFLIATPFAPSGGAATILFLAREALVEMDVPTRQSYVMAVVKPQERAFASGVTNVTRTVAWAVGSAMAGSLMQQVLGAPLFVGGTLKIAYDVMLYRAFRHIPPPEELPRLAGR